MCLNLRNSQFESISELETICDYKKWSTTTDKDKILAIANNRTEIERLLRVSKGYNELADLYC